MNQIVSAISNNAQITALDVTKDSEQLSLPLDVPAIEATQELFLPEEDDKHADIMKIIQICLKDVKRNNSKHAIKAISLLSIRKMSSVLKMVLK